MLSQVEEVQAHDYFTCRRQSVRPALLTTFLCAVHGLLTGRGETCLSSVFVASLSFHALADILKVDAMHARHFAQLSGDKALRGQDYKPLPARP